MTREEGIKAAIKKFQNTKDPTKPYPPTDHYAIREFWESRVKIKEAWYKRLKGIK